MSLADSFAVQILLGILPGIVNRVWSQEFVAPISSASKSYCVVVNLFLSVPKKRNNLFQTILNMLVFIVRRISAIHGVKFGKSLVFVVCSYKIARCSLCSLAFKFCIWIWILLKGCTHIHYSAVTNSFMRACITGKR